MKRLVSSGPSPSRRCSSPSDPRVAMLRTCVCPRVKRPEPCVRGKIPTWHEIARISVGPRPSPPTPPPPPHTPPAPPRGRALPPAPPRGAEGGRLERHLRTAHLGDELILERQD